MGGAIHHRGGNTRRRLPDQRCRIRRPIQQPLECHATTALLPLGQRPTPLVNKATLPPCTTYTILIKTNVPLAKRCLSILRTQHKGHALLDYITGPPATIKYKLRGYAPGSRYRQYKNQRFHNSTPEDNAPRVNIQRTPNFTKAILAKTYETPSPVRQPVV